MAGWRLPAYDSNARGRQRDTADDTGNGLPQGKLGDFGFDLLWHHDGVAGT